MVHSFSGFSGGCTWQLLRLPMEDMMDLTAISPATSQPAASDIDLTDPAIAKAFEEAAGTVFAVLTTPLLQQVLSSAND